MKKIIILLVVLSTLIFASENKTLNKKIAYIVSDTSIPFWQIMTKGLKDKSLKLGYEVNIYNSNNTRKNEIENFSKALKENVSGIVLSPINSSSAVFLLKLAKQAKIPVVISDIGTDSGEYVSFISSNNYDGAYKIGKVLASKMYEMNIQNSSVGIIGIPQQRENGKDRTKGFLKSINEEGIKSAGLEQQVNFSKQETYDLASKLIKKNPNMKALWLQGSDKYQGALDAIRDQNKDGEILLICFDSEPEFLEMIPNGKLVGAAMQQPFLMGSIALEQLHKHLNGKEVKRDIQLEILAIDEKNINSKLTLIKRNVLGITE
ncbi:substrate-binding domain-containing protein [Aliarcobacter butzleri]|uniref:substrate-binding domain-containing protein n=1 Tax=Aliarcobacter butzleri TaxID=28197 RepID=UPI00263D77C0|nr:substrate-binding domain-containing protein [Aliarcobacter butzleri]MDN5128604.1 substrate-binding domain-containing protein [Aliarcobacter butzleri]